MVIQKMIKQISLNITEIERTESSKLYEDTRALIQKSYQVLNVIDDSPYHPRMRNKLKDCDNQMDVLVRSCPNLLLIDK